MNGNATLGGERPAPQRAAGLARLNAFVSRAGRAYAGNRNFDRGPGNHSNVSMLSPYLRHRSILEQEVSQAVLEQHSLSAAERFVQEVFWRTYFKGWLEHRPQVWTSYRSSVANLLLDLDRDEALRERYETALAGTTGIDCFDAWVGELVASGYLHNHARMWFASIWVYTLGLPWELGADFFYRHLLDGDPASNTLSWRWVCGLHTAGKTYLARADNIARYTENRFDPAGQLAHEAPALEEDISLDIVTPQALPAMPENGRVGLLVTEEDSFAETLVGNAVAVIGLCATEARSPLQVGGPAREFAQGALADALCRAGEHFDCTTDQAGIAAWGSHLADWARQHDIAHIVTAYAPVGPVAEQIAAARPHLDRAGIGLFQVQRDYDALAWRHATGGFFKLKKQIPALLGELGIA